MSVQPGANFSVGRRFFLQAVSGGVAVSLAGWAMARNGLWMPGDDLPLTPVQTEGPFYPETVIEQQLFNDNDLVQKAAGHEFAKGQAIVVDGRVIDQKGAPLSGAVIEIWQACATGRYFHSQDAKNPALLDNNFQFWGRAITGPDGKYWFKSIVPGKYPGRTGRHIHFRIDAPGHKRLVTQCYFSDFSEDNAQDGVFRRLDAAQQRAVTVDVQKAESEPWRGSFDIVMAKL